MLSARHTAMISTSQTLATVYLGGTRMNKEGNQHHAVIGHREYSMPGHADLSDGVAGECNF